MPAAARGGSAPRPRPRGGFSPWKVPLDLYGHTPTEVAQYKTWTGFVFSLVVVLVVGASVGYVVYEYITLPYDLSLSEGLYDPELELAPETEVLVPEFGVQVVTSNRTFLNVEKYPDVVDIFFWQNFIFGDGAGGLCPGKFEGERCRKRVRIPSERCRYHGEQETDQHVDAFCPMWGYLEETVNDFGILSIDFVPTKDRFNATVPSLQGNFLDPVYSFVQAEVILNFTGLALSGPGLELEARDIYGGQIAYLVAYNTYELFDLGIDDPLQQEFRRWSRGVEVKEFLSSKVDIPLRARSIAKGNFVVDFDFLESEVADVVVSQDVVQELDDAVHVPVVYDLQNATGKIPLVFDEDTGLFLNRTPPETITLSEAFFHVDRLAQQVIMTPPSTIFDILGLVGGFLSLFSLLIGWPAMVINQYMFSLALKKAKKDGTIPEEYLDKDGAVKVDRANDVLEQLSRVKLFGKSRSRKYRKRMRSMQRSRSTSVSSVPEEPGPNTSQA